MHRLSRIPLLPLLALPLLVAAGGAVGLAVGFEQARETITADEIRAHLYFLSHDALEGRGPGTRGGRLAGEYIAAQFLRIGLHPSGDDYFQPVPVRGTTVDPASVSLTFHAGSQRLAGRYTGDAVVWPEVADATVQAAGEVVFVGYGVDAPEWRWDDFKGRELAGKVLVFLVGDPPAPPDEPRLFDGRAMTYYGRWTYKLEEARRRGAAGALIIHRADAAGYSWEVVESSWTAEQLALADTARERPLRAGGWITQDFARRLFGLADLDLDELYVQATRRDFRPVATGITMRTRMTSRTRAFEARNVIGILPGTHPERKNEVVVLTSHYDHLGIGAPVDGDSIYNGAYDNASGIGLLLEVAEAFARLDPGPDRTIVFLATDAEEAGLLGSRHYVDDPAFPLRRTVAALNTDGANLWGETDDVIGLGGDLSTLGDVLGERAEELGMTVFGDPVPEKGGFFRSDHFPFARAGVPVLYLDHGVRFRGRPPRWGERVLSEYDARHYHQPSDEYAAGFDLSGAVQQGRLLFGVAYDVATAERRPAWHTDSPYRRDTRRSGTP